MTKASEQRQQNANCGPASAPRLDCWGLPSAPTDLAAAHTGESIVAEQEQEKEKEKQMSAIPSDVKALLTKLYECFDRSEIGLIARNNSNGADSYDCPSCCGELRVKGYASGTIGLNGVEHDPSCALHGLWVMCDKLARTHPQYFGASRHDLP
ncbi:MAG: hypothetical protein KGS72_17520 [Cyanobacteria bacterium REEB67]|nr:hypothetical protein [Cyanobacteria bacterium REEB67]